MISLVQEDRPGWHDAVTTGMVGVLALAAQLPILDRSVVFMDEGQLVAIADRLRHGEVLYRDIYTGIYPGIYYLTSLLLDVFGEDVLVTRWAQAVVNALTAVCLWRIGLRVMRPAWAVVAPALYAVLVPIGFPGLTMFNYSPLALLFALGALACLLRQLESGRLADGVAAGLLLGACGLVKQNFGALAVASVVIGFAWCRRGAPLGRRSFAAGLLPLLAAGAAVGGAAVAALALAGALPDFVRATLTTAWESQLGAFHYPIPPILGSHPNDGGRFVFVYAPAALFGYLMRGEGIFGVTVTPLVVRTAIRLVYGGTLTALLAGGMLLYLERRAGPPQRRRATRATVVFAAVMFLGIFPSAIWSHLAFVMAPALLVLGLVCDRVAGVLAPRPALNRCWSAICALALVAALAVAGHIAFDLTRWYPLSAHLPRVSLRVSSKEHRLLIGGTRFIESCARPGEPIFVAPDIPILYFVMDRRNPTPYDLVIPGDVDGARIVERLRASGTRCIVYNPQMFRSFEPFEELFPRVAEAFTNEYQRTAVIDGDGAVWYGLVRKRGRWR